MRKDKKRGNFQSIVEERTWVPTPMREKTKLWMPLEKITAAKYRSQ